MSSDRRKNIGMRFIINRRRVTLTVRAYPGDTLGYRAMLTQLKKVRYGPRSGHAPGLEHNTATIETIRRIISSPYFLCFPSFANLSASAI